MVLTVGNGQCVRFWIDTWCKNGVLATRFPGLFELSSLQQGFIADYNINTNGMRSWNLHFRRALYDREINSLGTLLQAIENVVLTEEEDLRIWADESAVFEPKTVCGKLEKDRIEEEQTGCTYFPAKKIWIALAPSKVNFFIWALIRGCNLTTDNTRKRGRPMPLRTVMCVTEEESISHLFLNCRITKWLWNKVLGAFGLQVGDMMDTVSWFHNR